MAETSGEKKIAMKVSAVSIMINLILSLFKLLAGIFGARMGFPVLDPIASVVICCLIEKAAYEIFKDSIDKMVDKSCTDKEVNEMRELILRQQGVDDIDEIKTRLFGSKVYVDVEIAMDGAKSLLEAHTVAEQVHGEIEKNLPEVKHCMVHMNPLKEQSTNL